MRARPFCAKCLARAAALWYTTYYVYIVKEDDTVEKILTKYDITKEDFENYNDINNIKAGDKVIIPKKCE